jgi:hypothetical protein
MAWLPAQDRHQRRLLQLNFDHAPTQGYVEEFFGGNGATLRRWCECGGDRRPGRARACADHTASLTVQLLDPHVYADGALDAFEGS